MMQWLSRVDSGTGKYARALLAGLPYTTGFVKARKSPAWCRGGAEVMGYRGTEIRNKNGTHQGWMPAPKGF